MRPFYKKTGQREMLLPSGRMAVIEDGQEAVGLGGVGFPEFTSRVIRITPDGELSPEESKHLSSRWISMPPAGAKEEE